MINFYKPSKINLSIRPLLIASLVVVSNIFNVLIMPLSASAADEGPKYSVTTRTDKTPNLTNQPLTVYFDSKFSWNGQYNQVISGLAAHMYIYDHKTNTQLKEVIVGNVTLNQGVLKTTSMTFTPPTAGVYRAKFSFMLFGIRYWNDEAGLFKINDSNPVVTPESVSTLRSVDEGGPAAGVWTADNGYKYDTRVINNSATIDTSKVVNPAPMSVYQTSRIGKSLKYNLSNLTVGKTYKVRLHFNENYWTAPGKRVFSITNSKNQTLFSNIDLFNEAGLNKALVKEFDAYVDSSGSIDFSLNASVDQALLSGIELVGPNSAPTNVSKVFKTQGPKILDPNGNEFVAYGANMGIPGFLGTDISQAKGHALDAKAWGWNTIRLTVSPTDANHALLFRQVGREAIYKQIDDVVKEYTAQGIVVMIDAHEDIYKLPNRQYCYDEMEVFWKDIASKYKGNTYVWFNLMNEPGEFNAEYFKLHDRLAKAVRSQGAPNIIVMDPPQWGSDSVGGSTGWANFSYDANHGPKLRDIYGNIVIGQHNYGVPQYDTTEEYLAYIDAVHNAGLPLITTEIGFSLDNTSTAGSFSQNQRGAYAAMEANKQRNVGILWWSATNQASDKMSLMKKPGVNSSGSPITVGAAWYETGPNIVMTLGGRDFWNYGHPNNPVQ